MADPFRTRAYHKASQTLMRSLLRRLDIPNNDPLAAEVDLNNYFAKLDRLTDADEVSVAAIFGRYRVAGAERALHQQRILKLLLVHQMRDDRLSSTERAELHAVVHALGIPTATANDIIRTTATEIYLDRLAAARADGVISAEERQVLAGIRTVFDLQVQLPEAGRDFAQSITLIHNQTQALILEAGAQLRANARRLANVRRAMPECDEHHLVLHATDRIQAWKDTVDDIAVLLQEITGSDAEAYTLMESALDRARALDVEMRGPEFQSAMETICGWKSMSEARVKRENAAMLRSAEEQRQSACRTAAVAAGFQVVRGSASARAWAYCVIAEECLNHPDWTTLAAATVPDAVAFRDWLRDRPASFWTDVFMTGSFDSARAAYARDAKRGQRSKRPPADFDLQIT